MRILNVSSGYYPEVGGVERHVRSLSEHLAQSGHEVVVATPTSSRTAPRGELLGGVEVRRFTAIGPSAYRVPLGMLRYLRREGPGFDIIHAFNYHALPLLLAAISGSSKVVISPCYHGTGHTLAARLLHVLYDPFAVRMLKRVQTVVCLSSGEASQVGPGLQMAPEHISVIPSGIALGEESTEHPVPKEQGLLLAVGRLAAYKGVDHCIAALPHLPEHYTLILVGSGPMQDKLEALARRLGVVRRVRLLGHVDDAVLNDWYQRAVVVLSMSEFESFGITVLEALAHGCRIVCSDIPAFRDFAGRFPGMVSLVDPSDPKHAALAIQAAATRPERAIDLGNYYWPKVAEAHLAVYSRDQTGASLT